MLIVYMVGSRERREGKIGKEEGEERKWGEGGREERGMEERGKEGGKGQMKDNRWGRKEEGLRAACWRGMEDEEVREKG